MVVELLTNSEEFEENVEREKVAITALSQTAIQLLAG